MLRLNRFFDLYVTTFQAYKSLCSLNLYFKPRNLLNHIEYVFGDYDFKGKRVLDVGGGAGLLRFWSLPNGASSSAVLLEPELEGCTLGIISSIQINAHALRVEDKFVHLRTTIQDYLASHSGITAFDFIVYANSVNHINEHTVENFFLEPTIRNFHIDHFRQLAKITTVTNTRLFLTDYSCYNFFDNLPPTNLLEPAIEWIKHLSPSDWMQVLEEVSFSNFVMKWFSPNSPSWISPFVSNKIVNYLTFSFFSLSSSYLG